MYIQFYFGIKYKLKQHCTALSRGGGGGGGCYFTHKKLATGMIMPVSATEIAKTLHELGNINQIYFYLMG